MKTDAPPLLRAQRFLERPCKSPQRSASFAMQGQVVLLEFPDTGHINPSLPIVAELSKRFQVTCFLPERFRQLVESLGARWHRWDPPEVTEAPNGSESF